MGETSYFWVLSVECAMGVPGTRPAQYPAGSDAPSLDLVSLILMSCIDADFQSSKHMQLGNIWPDTGQTTSASARWVGELLGPGVKGHPREAWRSIVHRDLTAMKIAR